ncbi:hypothetical protein LINPERHAP1_LOCUS20271 [Linum perenne]
MRVRARFDDTKPLVKGRKVRRPGGEWLKAKFRYERLPAFCYVCGRIGHIERHCEIWYQTSEDKLVRGWSSELRAELKRGGGNEGEQWIVRSGEQPADEVLTQGGWLELTRRGR